jgi:hypothetical protein
MANYGRTSNRQNRTPTIQTQVTSKPGQAAIGDSVRVTEKQMGKLTNGGIGNATHWAGLPITGLEQPRTYLTGRPGQRGRQWVTEYPRNPIPEYGSYIQGRQIGRDSYGTMITRELVRGKPGVAAEIIFKRKSLGIDKAETEGKQDLIDEANKPVQTTAEDILKRRLALIRMKGRASMPSSSASKDEPTVNVSSGGAIGLNFA